MKTKVVGFNASVWKQELAGYWIEQQNAALVEYAKNKIIEIGNKIKTYHSKNGMDATGNLLDSLYWGVSYNGKFVGSGFYRKKKATEDSYLHEWFPPDYRNLYPVNGRLFAQQHLETYISHSDEGRGWKVWFAILAPYWGYWENGFKMKRKISVAGNSGDDEQSNTATTFMRFAVMTETYDTVKPDLKPARVRFRHPVSKYSMTKIEKRRERDFEGKIKNYYRY